MGPLNKGIVHRCMKVGTQWGRMQEGEINNCKIYWGGTCPHGSCPLQRYWCLSQGSKTSLVSSCTDFVLILKGLVRVVGYLHRVCHQLLSCTCDQDGAQSLPHRICGRRVWGAFPSFLLLVTHTSSTSAAQILGQYWQTSLLSLCRGGRGKSRPLHKYY